MFNARSREIREFERTLNTLSRRALPIATQKMLNDTAFDAMRTAKDNIERDMVNRNTWTQRSVRVNKAKAGPIHQQKSEVGSTEAYMRVQEKGGKKKTGNVPTTYSAGQSPGASVRTRVPRKANRMNQLQLTHHNIGRTRKQRNLLAVRSGAKFVYLDLGHRRGIFKITGGKKKPKVNMVHELGHKGAPIKKHPWLRPASNEARQRAPRYYKDALEYQMAKLGAS